MDLYAVLGNIDHVFVATTGTVLNKQYGIVMVVYSVSTTRMLQQSCASSIIIVNIAASAIRLRTLVLPFQTSTLINGVRGAEQSGIVVKLYESYPAGPRQQTGQKMPVRKQQETRNKGMGLVCFLYEYCNTLGVFRGFL